MIVLQQIERILLWVAVLATAIIMVMTSGDAIMRYVFNKPFVGAYEVTEKYLMIAAIFLGFPYAYRGGAFIRVTFLVDALPGALKTISNWISYLISIGCCGLLLYATGLQGWQGLADNTTLATLPIPIGPSQLLVPIGFLALLILMLLDLKRVSSGEALLFVQESPSEASS